MSLAEKIQNLSDVNNYIALSSIDCVQALKERGINAKVITIAYDIDRNTIIAKQTAHPPKD